MPRLVPEGGFLPAGMRPKGSLSSYKPKLREKFISKLARGWYGDTREGYKKATRLAEIADLTPVGMATGMYDAGRSFGQGNQVQAGIMAAMSGLPIPGALKKDAMKGIRAYHGSPHSFDKFDMSRIGTGEGAQSYGHGLYFAEGEGVAKSYRDALSPGRGASAADIATRVTQSSGSREAAIKELQQRVDYGNLRRIQTPEFFVENPELNEALELLKSGKDFGGHMYEVNIDADPEQFLDWDSPITADSPQNIRDALNKVANSRPEIKSKLSEQVGKPGSMFYSVLNDAARTGDLVKNQTAATEALRNAGIPGIKYLDAGSRAKGDGSRNYVVFDDKLVKIMRKYGLGGLIGTGAGVKALQQQQDEQRTY